MKPTLKVSRPNLITGSFTVHVPLGERSYDILLRSDTPTVDAGLELRSFARHCSPGSFALVVCDEHVLSHATGIASALSAEGFTVGTTMIPPGEGSKCLAQASQLYDVLAEAQADRRSLVVAVGGGVVGDLAGFVASTWNRGIPLLMVPTTLLAMVDSSVGGKVGINHARGKNLIGAFHQPRGVWINTTFLDTLPDREYRSGLAEVVKYGVILDPELFVWLENEIQALRTRHRATILHLVKRSCELKASVVAVDEFEQTGQRVILNYGHTFAHAFETVAGYGCWLHGEAVAAGMVAASRLAERLGRISTEITQRQVNLLRSLELPTELRSEWSIDELVRVMRSDKKAHKGRLRFVLPTRLGQVELVEVEEHVVREVLA